MKISKITLYVSDQQQSKHFWVDQCGFILKREQTLGPVTWIEVAPEESSETSFVLYDKGVMLAQNPKANVSHPSVILSTEHIDEIYTHFQSQKIEVGEKMSFPYGKMFSFKDNDKNDFLIRESD